jgi:hypothetical protein
MKELTSKGGEVRSVVAFVDIEKEKNSDVSPLTSDSAASLLGSDGLRKPKSLQMTVAQKQEQRARDFAEWSNHKDAHKAATRLYVDQLSVKGGLSVCKVEKKNLNLRSVPVMRQSVAMLSI